MMQRNDLLAQQTGFGLLLLCNLQNDSLALDAIDSCCHHRHGESAIFSHKSGTPDRVRVTNICPEVYALLAAAQESAARRVDNRREDALDGRAMELDENGPGSKLQKAHGGWHDAVTIDHMLPTPKRFYRTFWKSVSRRLVYRWRHTGLSTASWLPENRRPSSTAGQDLSIKVLTSNNRCTNE
jgi:hypothetical protein